MFDPTVGAGTTMMEALTHARNAMGIEIQYIDVLRANLETPAAKASAVMAIAVHGDARQTDEHLAKFMIRPRLVVNNPPYFGDQIQTGFSSRGGKVLLYSEKYRNLAFLKEGPEYFKIMGEIYRACSDRMPKGGHLVLGIKDQMRNRKPDGLHTKLIETVHAACPGLRLKTIVLLPHHPTTLFMHTYPKRFGVPVPVYQTIMSFVKR